MAFSIDSQLHPHLTPYLEGDDGDLIALVIKEPRLELGDGRPPVTCIVGPNPDFLPWDLAVREECFRRWKLGRKLEAWGFAPPAKAS